MCKDGHIHSFYSKRNAHNYYVSKQKYTTIVDKMSVYQLFITKLS